MPNSLNQLKSCKNRQLPGCIVLYVRLFPNTGDKTRPFTIYDTFMQRVRVETQIEIQNNINRV